MMVIWLNLDYSSIVDEAGVICWSFAGHLLVICWSFAGHLLVTDAAQT